MNPATQKRINAILDDPGTSYWLKHALAAALTRDPVDASNDAELLAAILSEIANQDLDAGTQLRSPHDPSNN